MSAGTKVLVVGDRPARKRVFITNGEVMSFAKNGKGCSLCSPPGQHTYVVRDENGNPQRQLKLCPKTWQRFLKRVGRPVLQDMETKQFFYEIDAPPEEAKIVEG